MESNAVWLPSLFAKQRVPSGMGFDFSALRFLFILYIYNNFLVYLISIYNKKNT
jgi:hypothetical protein